MEPMMYDEFVERKKRCEELDPDNITGLMHSPECYILNDEQLKRAGKRYFQEGLEVVGGYMDADSICLYYKGSTNEHINTFVKYYPDLEDLNAIVLGGEYVGE